ncbi:RICIN domain-containing protein [Flavobacterium sp. HTF]|uniref:RICIN domain-containing protein n=1 Tax=Flavobacterium sp. HTF TaxID=2170732 RepID=UPI0014032CE7|nr:RICIN domain-containing protein [Flavobacterium sp. HTF]
MIQIKLHNYNLIDKLKLRFVLVLMFVSFAGSLQAQTSGNPLFTGADPEIHYFNNKYYIYTTAIYGTQFHAYSSTDLTNWHDEGLIFDLFPDSPWAQYNGWAPAVVFRNNKYYFYYTAETKIGLAVGNTPIGPFTDIGAPLIATDPYTDDIIDANVFIDDDGQAYIYYGGSGKSRMVVRKLNADMVSLATGPTDITPQNYTEGPYMVKRKGVYYMTYSNGAWYNDTYNVQYSTSNSPMGPWTYRGKILSSNIEDKGPGHHGVLKMGNCDEYYIVYHRYENGTSGDRKIAIDRMYFNSNDLIEPVNMTNYGVAPRIPDQSCPTQSIVSGGIYKLTHKGTNQCLDVFNNSNQPGANVQQSTDNGSDAQRWVVTLEADGFYKLTHKGTNQCLDVFQNSSVQGANVQQSTDSGNNAQRWKIEIMSDGYAKLTHKGTNQCLDVDNNSSQSGANVQQWTDNPNANNDAQRWKLDLIEVPIVSGGIYRLTHKGTNQSLDVSDGSIQQGANVQQYTSNETDAQRWVITKESDGFYKLTHRGTNQCLDVDNNSSQPGANVQQWTDLGTDAQRWKIELMSDGYFKLTHKNTNLCLDVVNNLAEPGTNVHQWTDNNNDAQRWKLDLLKPVTTLGTAQFSKPSVQNQNLTAAEAVNVYPNPVKNTLFFSSEMKGISVHVFSETGSLVSQQIIKENSIDVSALATGIYFAVFEKDGTKTTKRFIKK